MRLRWSTEPARDRKRVPLEKLDGRPHEPEQFHDEDWHEQFGRWRVPPESLAAIRAIDWLAWGGDEWPPFDGVTLNEPGDTAELQWDGAGWRPHPLEANQTEDFVARNGYVQTRPTGYATGAGLRPGQQLRDQHGNVFTIGAITASTLAIEPGTPVAVDAAGNPRPAAPGEVPVGIATHVRTSYDGDGWRTDVEVRPLTVEVQGPPLPPGLLPWLLELADNPADRAVLEQLAAAPERIRGCTVYRDEARRRDVYEFQLVNGLGARAVAVTDAALVEMPRRFSIGWNEQPQAPLEDTIASLGDLLMDEHGDLVPTTLDFASLVRPPRP